MKFLTDAMFGRVTRLLRMFGYDTVYAEDVESSAPDDTLLAFAKKENRLIITRDLPFYERAKDNCFYTKEVDPYRVLSILREEINLIFNFNMTTARCSVCNSLLNKVNDKETIRNHIKAETYMSYTDFYQCNNHQCKKIYWKGSHIEKVLNKLKETM